MPELEKKVLSEKKARAAAPVICEERCKGCGICTAFCPDKALALGDRTNAFGYQVVRMTAPACRGCGRCYLMCPDVVFSFDGEESAPCRP